MERVLVTGGAGFIGSHLTQTLVKQGLFVRVLDNVSTGRVANLEGLGRKIDFMNGDIRNAVACRNACRGMDTVFHLAAMVSVPQSVQDPIQSDAINCGGTLNLLLAARDCQVARFVFASSSAVYGHAEVAPTPESLLPIPLSPYGIQKLTGEHYARNFTRLYGLPTVALRLFNVYGARQDPQSEYAAVIPRFLTRLLAGQPPRVFGDGEQTRDFCHVNDVVAALLLAARTESQEILGTVFNIAGGAPVTLNKLLEILRNVTGSDLAACYEAPRAGDIRHSSADIRRAKSLLGFLPKVKLAAGLKEATRYYRQVP